MKNFLITYSVPARGNGVAGVTGIKAFSADAARKAFFDKHPHLVILDTVEDEGEE